MPNETQTQTTKLVLETGDISKGLEKLERDVFKIGVKTEETLAKLNSQSNLYKTLEANHSRLVDFQTKINRLKNDDTKSTLQINKELQSSLSKFAIMKQQVTDINKVLITTPSAIRNQENELKRVQDRFANLSREVRQLEGHYKGFGSNKGLDALKTKLVDIKKQQEIISTLSSKGIVNLTSSDLKTLDLAKAKYRALKNEVAEIKTDLSDVPLSGLARSAGVRALGYSALFGAIALTTQAISKGVEYVLEYEQSVIKLGVILNVSSDKALELQENIVSLSKAYGDSLKEINEVALSLGRAGVKFDEVAKATEAVVKLAKLTGDSVETATGAVVSFIQVFGKNEFGEAIKSTEELGAMIAFIANESKLSIQDINTLGNYALQTAKALNLTENALGAVAIALSNSGVNSSSLGTSVRRLQKIFTTSSPAIEKFFDSIGLNRQKLLLDFAKGGDASNKAFGEFIKTLSQVDTSEFIRLTGSFDVLIKETLNQLKNNANPILDSFNDSFNVTNEELNKANKLAETNIATFKRLGNTLLDVSNNAGFLLDTLADASKGLTYILNNMNKFSPKGVALTLGKDNDILEVSIKRLKEYEQTLLNLNKQDKNSNVSASLINVNNQIEKELKRIKGFMPSLGYIPFITKDLRDDFKTQVAQLENLAKDSFSKLNLQDIFSSQEQKLKLKSQIFDLEIKAEFGELDEAEKELLKKLREIRNTIKKQGKIELSDFLNTSDVEALKKQGTALSSFYGSTSKTITNTIKENFSYLDSQLNKSINELNNSKNKLVKFEVPITVGNISNEFVKITQELFNTQNKLKALSGDSLEDAKQDIIVISKKKELLGSLLELQTFITTQNEKLALAQEKNRKEIEKELKKQDEKTKIITKQLVANTQLADSDKSKSKQLLDEIEARKSNLMLLKSEKAYKQELARIAKLEAEYSKISNSAKLNEKYKSITEELKAQQKAIEDRIPLEVALLHIKNKEKLNEGLISQKEYDLNTQKINQIRQMTDAITRNNEVINIQNRRWKTASEVFEDYANKVPSLGEALGQVADVGLQSLENGMMDFFDVTSEGFGDMETLAKSVLKSIYQELIRTLIVKQAVSSIGSFFGFADGGMLPITKKENGGYLPSKNFATGGILTGGSGVKDDLYLGSASGSRVFAMGGEYFTKKDSVNSNTKPMLDYINKNGTVPKMGVSGGTVVSTSTTINIENQTGTPIEADMIEQFTKSNENDDYEKVINIMLKAKNEDSRIRSVYSN